MAQQPELRGVKSGEKNCAVCGVINPANAFYFDRDRTTDDGWNPKCKQCRRKHEQDKDNKEIATNVATLRDKLLTEIADGGGRKPMVDIGTAGEVVLEAFGGIEGLAAKLAADYEATPVGTPGRVKLLLGVTSFLAKAMEQAQPVDLGSLSTDTIKRLLKDAMGDEYRRLTDESEDSPPVGGPEAG